MSCCRSQCRNLRVRGDERHIQLLVALTIKPKAVALRGDLLLNADQLWKLSLDHEFIRRFMEAYERDYGFLDNVN